MRSTILFTTALFSSAFGRPQASGAGGLDIGALLKGAGGAGGIDIGALLGAAKGLGGPGGPNLSALMGGGADANVIITGYTTSKDKLDILDRAVNALSNSTTPGASSKALLPLTQAVKDAIKSSTDAITKLTGTVDLLSSAGFSAPGEDLTQLLETTVDDLIKQKNVIAKAGQKAAILKDLQELKTITVAFTGAIESKLPDISKAVAAGSSARPVAALDKGIAAFT
jgi:hypothetical protein